MDVECCNKPAQPDQLETMKHLLHGVAEYGQENFIMVRYGIMNRLVYSFHEETSVFSLICIYLPIQ